MARNSQPEISGQKYMARNLRPEICGPKFAARNLRPENSGQKYMARNLRPEICGPPFPPPPPYGTNPRSKIFAKEKYEIFFQSKTKLSKIFLLNASKSVYKLFYSVKCTLIIVFLIINDLIEQFVAFLPEKNCQKISVHKVYFSKFKIPSFSFILKFLDSRNFSFRIYIYVGVSGPDSDDRWPRRWPR